MQVSKLDVNNTSTSKQNMYNTSTSEKIINDNTSAQNYQSQSVYALTFKDLLYYKHFVFCLSMNLSKALLMP